MQHTQERLDCFNSLSSFVFALVHTKLKSHWIIWTLKTTLFGHMSNKVWISSQFFEDWTFHWIICFTVIYPNHQWITPFTLQSDSLWTICRVSTHSNQSQHFTSRHRNILLEKVQRLAWDDTSIVQALEKNSAWYHLVFHTHSDQMQICFGKNLN